MTAELLPCSVLPRTDRNEIAQVGDRLLDDRDGPIDFVLGVVFAECESNAAVDQIFIEADRG